MENFKKCAIFFMCILVIFVVFGMIWQCDSLKTNEEKQEDLNNEYGYTILNKKGKK